MEWILILILAAGPVTVPRPFPNEAECLGAGQLAIPQCNSVIGSFDRVEQVCGLRRFICVPQPIPRKLTRPRLAPR
jgi:hypothetical protein